MLLLGITLRQAGYLVDNDTFALNDNCKVGALIKPGLLGWMR